MVWIIRLTVNHYRPNEGGRLHFDAFRIQAKGVEMKECYSWKYCNLNNSDLKDRGKENGSNAALNFPQYCGYVKK